MLVTHGGNSGSAHISSTRTCRQPTATWQRLCEGHNVRKRLTRSCGFDPWRPPDTAWPLDTLVHLYATKEEPRCHNGFDGMELRLHLYFLTIYMICQSSYLITRIGKLSVPATAVSPARRPSQGQKDGMNRQRSKLQNSPLEIRPTVCLQLIPLKECFGDYSRTYPQAE